MVPRRPSLNLLRQRSFTKSSTPHSIAIDLRESQSFTMPPIADIFDAPVRLGASNVAQLIPRARARLPSIVTATPSSVETPTTLPPPLVFDGPANPRHSSLSLLSTKATRQSRALDNHRMHHTQTSILLPFSSPPPYTYDGPSRITRYRYSGQKKKYEDARKPLLAVLSIVTLAAGATVVSNKELEL
ncbi:hypothetical protein BDP27DRAFT_1309677 [Rhodocollybia butyracea]|uniref:Uncharacterized protein n=1 Tax=Rhodocollybia butyracea TaxID=206335 RepID=A0A9P5UH37_9AGAR|nr:hypothetical protein BDP27DRAFT_1309677 [Rhodocollybia butyracea]